MSGPGDRPSLANRIRTAEFRSVAVSGLFVLAVLYTLHLARDLVLPIVLALFLSLLLLPVVRLLRRLRVPAPVAPALVLLLLVAGGGTALYQMWAPATAWVARAPQDLKVLQGRVRKIIRSVEQVTRTAAQVDEITDVAGSDAPQVALRQPSLSETLFGGAWHLLAGGVVVLVLAYFFLASGDHFLRKLPRVMPREEADRVIAIVQETEAQISRYLLAVTLINLGVGLVSGVVFALLGMPTPVLLGALAAVLNFVPYVGPITMAVLLTMVALVTFPEPGQAVPPPLAYLALHALEANFLTPHLLGRRLPLSPVVIFVSFLFWWWLWGVAGAILAVPIMVTIKIACDRSEGLTEVGELLGR
ncbi:MAG: AI-2E family transporter [Gemmatimonadales bacterium]